MFLQLFSVCSHSESCKGIVSTVSQIQSFEIVVKYVYLLEMGIRCCCLYPSPLLGPSHPKCEHEITIQSFNIVIATGWSQTEPCFPGAILSRRWMSLPNSWQWKAPVDSLLLPTKTLGFDEMKPALVLLRASSYISAAVFTARAASGNAPSALSILSSDSIEYFHSLSQAELKDIENSTRRRDVAQALPCSTPSPLPFWVSGWCNRHNFVTDISHPGKFMSVFLL